MVEALLVTGAGELLKKVCSLATQEIGAAWSLKRELKKLERSFSMVQAVLVDAERRQVEDQTVRLWLQRLKQVAYDADDVLDEFQTELLHHKMETRKGFRSKVQNFFSHSNSFAFQFKIAHKIRDINESLVQIEKDKTMFKFSELHLGVTNDNVRNREKTSSHLNVSRIVGRETETMSIVNLLVNSTNQDDVVSVVPIVGIGGLGKTTLAQIVYNHMLLQEFFDLRIWVCVSEVFDVERISRQIIESITKTECGLTNMDVMVSSMQEKMSGKRFLLVLDDVWNEEVDKWEKLKSLLGGSSVRGCKIIVTTRSEKVASLVGTLPTHHLQKLSEEECWLLFRQWAFKSGGAEETSKFVEIGKDIVRKCGGVPLALMHLGGLMQFKKDEHEWMHIRDSEIWWIPENRKIIGILKMSYDSLSSPLKLCFSYCAIFPKDEIIKKKMLIQLWMAEGFLQQPGRSTRVMEDIGYEYWNILMQNSFFQDVQMYEFECTFKMHDLVHDLARSVVGQESCFQNVEIGADFSKIRYLASSSGLLESLPSMNKLRTFVVEQEPRPSLSVQVLNNWFLKLKYLRVLDLYASNIEKLPSSLSKLTHLRFLCLSDNPIVELPDSICSLFNLQTLRLLYCKQLNALPKETRKLISLRHLELEGCEKLQETPRDIGQLSSLQTLSMFVVGTEGSGCTLRELQHLNLGGKIKLLSLENVPNETEARDTNFEQKSNIHTLELVWYHVGIDVDALNGINADDVLQGLRPHSNLQKLGIHRYLGLKSPTWLNVTFLPNLVEIELSEWRKCKHLPPFGQLPRLRLLTIYDMDCIRCIGNEFYVHDGHRKDLSFVFPSLRELHLQNMSNLIEWVEPALNGNHICLFPLLEKLTIDGCPKLTKTPRIFPSLKKLNVQRSSSSSSLESLSSKVSSLTTLRIQAIDDMKFVPKGLLERNGLLRKLIISDCPELRTLRMDELQHLKCLETLHLKDCRSLTYTSNLQCLTSMSELFMYGNGMECFPDWLPCLPLLDNLIIGKFRDVDCFSLDGIQKMVSLRLLGLVGWRKINFLPRQISHLTSLEWLSIFCFESIEALPDWLTSLSSLQTLKIVDCVNLKHLPEGLLQLNTLLVIKCPLLKNRCEREGGEEWHKIAHIPFVEFKD